MAQDLEEMPLFPLNTVLFPHALVQLHIFEDRYREMIKHCLTFDRPFGIVLIRSGEEVGGSAEPYLVGTAVRILKVNTYDDGRMDVQVKGERRFRIRDLDDSSSYLVGKVEPVIEHALDTSPESTLLLERARDEFQIYIQRRFANQDFVVQVVFPADPVDLSFAIANMLQMENLEKQRLLETTDTRERFEDLLPIMEQQMLEDFTPQYFKLTADDLREWIWPN